MLIVLPRRGLATLAAFAFFMLIPSLNAYTMTLDATEVVLEERGIVITLGELAEYVSDGVRPQAEESAVARKGAVAQSVGNLYIIRRAARLAEENELISSDRLSFVARDAADREAVERYVESETVKRLDSVDWDALAREQFLKDADLYASEERVRASHILVSRENRSFSALAARVAEVEARLKAGDPFDLVAVEMSDDPSALRNRGSLGLLKRGDTVGPFEAVVFNMSEEGATSDPFLTIFGVHIVRFEGQETGESTPFIEVRDRIIEQLQKKRSKVTRDLILEPYRGEVQDQLYLLDEPRLADGILDLIGERAR